MNKSQKEKSVVKNTVFYNALIFEISQLCKP